MSKPVLMRNTTNNSLHIVTRDDMKADMLVNGFEVVTRAEQIPADRRDQLIGYLDPEARADAALSEDARNILRTVRGLASDSDFVVWLKETLRMQLETGHWQIPTEVKYGPLNDGNADKRSTRSRQ